MINRMHIRPTSDKAGAVLVVTLLVLALITIMGVYSATKAGMETKIAGNAKWKTVAFFAAEAGLNHAKELLTQKFADANTVTGATTYANWDFALAPATYYHCQNCDTDPNSGLLKGPWLDNGVIFLKNSVKSGTVTFEYTVYVWDNFELTYEPVPTDAFFCMVDTVEGGVGTYTIADKTGGKIKIEPTVDNDPTRDCDSTIVIRSVALATTSNGDVLATSVQELSVSATTSGEAILPGLGQEFEGSGDVDLKGASTGAGSSTIAY